MTNAELLDLLLRAREFILRFGKTEEDHNLRDRIDKLLAKYDALPIIDWDSDEKPGRTGWGRARVMHYGRTDDVVFVIAEKDGKFMLGEAGQEFVPYETLEAAKDAAAVELKRRLNDDER